MTDTSSLLERADFTLFMLTPTIPSEETVVMGGYSVDGFGGEVNVVFHHRLGDGRLVRVGNSNYEVWRPDDPAVSRATSALRSYFQAGGTLPATIEGIEMDLRVGLAVVHFVGVRCGGVWVADAVVEGTNVRVEGVDVSSDQVAMVEVPDSMRRRHTAN